MRHESIVPEVSSAAIPPSGVEQPILPSLTRGENTTRAKAESYLRQAARWVATSELCKHLEKRADGVIPALRVAERCGTVQSKAGKRSALQWRWIPQDATGCTFSIDWPPRWQSRWEEARRAIP